MQKVKSIKLQWYSDPSHAWLKIRRRDADELGILGKVSHYSYQSKAGNTLYLEEDCDAPLVLDALRDSTYILPQYLNDKYSRTPSKVRTLAPFFHHETVEVYRHGESLFDKLDKVEALIRRKIKPTYEIPRPSFDYPWGLEQYYEVLDRARDYIKEMGYYAYHNAEKSLIVTTDRNRMIADCAQIARILQIIHVK